MKSILLLPFIAIGARASLLASSYDSVEDAHYLRAIPRESTKLVVLEKLCEDSFASLDSVYDALAARHPSRAELTLAKAYYEELQSRVSVPEFIHTTLFQIAKNIEPEYNRNRIDRYIASIERRQTKESAGLREHINMWMKDCAVPLVKWGQANEFLHKQPPCRYEPLTGRWVMNSPFAKELFCGLYQEEI